MTRASTDTEVRGLFPSGQALSWEVSGPRDCFSVGHHPVCQWHVDEDGVAAVHFDVVIQPDSMWLVPRAPVYVDGQLAAQTRPLADGAIVDFGSARLRIGRRRAAAQPIAHERLEQIDDHPTDRMAVVTADEPTRLGILRPSPTGPEPSGRRQRAFLVAEELTRIGVFPPGVPKASKPHNVPLERTIILPLAATPQPQRPVRQFRESDIELGEAATEIRRGPIEPPRVVVDVEAVQRAQPGPEHSPQPAIGELFALPAEVRRAPAHGRGRGRKLIVGTALLAAAAALIVLFGSHRRAAASQSGDGPPPSAPPATVQPPAASIIPVQTGAAIDLDRTAERNAADHLIDGRLDQALSAYQALAEASPADRRYPAMVGLIQREIAERCRSSTNLSDPLCVER